jgi:putative endonuclease
MYYVYVLQSQKDKKFYTGRCGNLEARIKRHNKGLVKATKSRIPMKIIYYEACSNIKDAAHRETYLKTSWGKHYIKSRLSNFLKETKRRSQLSRSV